MSRFDRIYKIHELLRTSRQPVPMSRFMEILEASRNSVTRDFEYLRNQLGAPLEYCREHNGHRYDPSAPVFELPGFWMSASELYALLACEQLLEQVQPGLLSDRLIPLKERIRNLLSESGHEAALISDKILIQPTQARERHEQLFAPIAEATLSGHQIRLAYQPRSTDRSSIRTIHPQRLIHYRSNWYLAAFCEQNEALRMFSLDRIQHPTVLDIPCKVIDADEVERYLSGGFGIFSGPARGVAKLRFSAQAARWVAEERWHPEQVGQWLDGAYHLALPYSDTPELVMDILRYGPDVEVLDPPELRDEVAARIKKMHEIYW